MISAAHRHTTAPALTAGAVLLSATVLLIGELTPGYDHRYDTVSRLASPGQPYALVVRAAIVAIGVLVMLTATALRASDTTYRRPLRPLLGLAGVAAVVVGLVPKDPPDVDPTAASQLHVAATLVGVGALVAAMVCMTWTSPHRVERRRSAASLTLIAVAGAAFPFAWGTVIYGLLQRTILLAALAWLITTARPDTAREPTPRRPCDRPRHHSFRSGHWIRRLSAITSAQNGRNPRRLSWATVVTRESSVSSTGPACSWSA